MSKKPFSLPRANRPLPAAVQRPKERTEVPVDVMLSREEEQAQALALQQRLKVMAGETTRPEAFDWLMARIFQVSLQLQVLRALESVA